MMIAGVVANSFVDYPGKIAMVIFAPGCNFNCWYCHNEKLIKPHKTGVLYNPAAILKDIERKKDFLDAVVISGGEPTLQSKLIEFTKSIKETGLLVKLDTNGSNPEKIKELLNENLLDYIAMDIKAPFDKYNDISGKMVDTDKIKQSIDIIIKSAPDYQFRTTVVPGITKEDIIKIANSIKGAKRYSLQQYLPALRTKNILPYPDEFLYECKDAISGIIDNISVLGLK